MTRRLAHRGPDDEGLWSDPEVGIALGHRRLSIVDLSPAGHEPMHSASGRLVVSYNGEIYNHQALRAELERRSQAPEGGWRGHSDIETFLEAIDHWGLEAALDAATGMFAFALWDRRERRLRLVRDRFGEKPLYYGWAGKDFLFASELKSLRAHPGFETKVDRDALSLYAARSCVPAPRTIFRSAFKLEPGCVLTVAAGRRPRLPDVPPTAGYDEDGFAIRRFYDYRRVVGDGNRRPFADKAEALDALDAALGDAIDGQRIADVPVGAFLSGGIDSSTICAVYQRRSTKPAHTFSIGFEEGGYDEARHARRVASHLGTVHHEHYVSAAEARDVIPLLPGMYDEPFADASQIPTYLVSRFARRSVTVALTGDGGDELFGGYNRHVFAPALWAMLRRIPGPVRRAAGAPLARLPATLWAGVAAVVRGQRQPGMGHKLRKGMALAASARTFDDVYLAFLDEWSMRPAVVLRDGTNQSSPVIDIPGDLPDLARVACYDALTYLPDDILCKVDRAAMAVSLETRVPFLDHRVAAVAARIPPEWKVNQGRGKQILRDYLHRFVPMELVDRPKAGFAVPLGEWLRGPLRDWAENLLDQKRLGEEGYFDVELIVGRWREVLNGVDNAAFAIWGILTFQAWLNAEAER